MAAVCLPSWGTPLNYSNRTISASQWNWAADGFNPANYSGSTVSAGSTKVQIGFSGANVTNGTFSGMTWRNNTEFYTEWLTMTSASFATSRFQLGSRVFFNNGTQLRNVSFLNSVFDAGSTIQFNDVLGYAISFEGASINGAFIVENGGSLNGAGTQADALNFKNAAFGTTSTMTVGSATSGAGDWRYTNFSGASLNGTINIWVGDASYSTFSGVTFGTSSQTYFNNGAYKGVVFDNTTLNGTLRFSGTDSSSSSWKSALFNGTFTVSGGAMENANFTGARFNGTADFSAGSVNGTTFKDTVFGTNSMTYFRNGTYIGAVFDNALFNGQVSLNGFGATEYE